MESVQIPASKMAAIKQSPVPPPPPLSFCEGPRILQNLRDVVFQIIELPLYILSFLQWPSTTSQVSHKSCSVKWVQRLMTLLCTVTLPKYKEYKSWKLFFYATIFFFFFLWIFFFLFVQCSALLYLPPLKFHCADGCWDQTQDHCNLCIGSQTL